MSMGYGASITIGFVVEYVGKTKTKKKTY